MCQVSHTKVGILYFIIQIYPILSENILSDKTCAKIQLKLSCWI